MPPLALSTDFRTIGFFRGDQSAQRDPQAAARMLGAALSEEIEQLSGLSRTELVAQREERFLGIGG